VVGLGRRGRVDTSFGFYILGVVFQKGLKGSKKSKENKIATYIGNYLKHKGINSLQKQPKIKLKVFAPWSTLSGF